MPLSMGRRGSATAAAAATAEAATAAAAAAAAAPQRSGSSSSSSSYDDCYFYSDCYGYYHLRCCPSRGDCPVATHTHTRRSSQVRGFRNAHLVSASTLTVCTRTATALRLVLLL